jgi:hypothetical protein
VRHVLAFAGLLKVPPADFLAAGCPEATAAATHRLSDWIGPRQGADGGQAAQRAVVLSPEELAELVRREVRNELAKFGIQRAPEEPQ